MFSHVMVGTNDLERSRAFYDAVLGALGVKPGTVDRHRVFWRSPSGVFSASLPIDGQPATVGNGSTLGFACASPEQVEACRAAGMDAHVGKPIQVGELVATMAEVRTRATSPAEEERAA